MLSKKFVLSILLAIAFSFGSTSIYVYADELLTPVKITSTTEIVNENDDIKNTQAGKDKESSNDLNTSTLSDVVTINEETTDKVENEFQEYENTEDDIDLIEETDDEIVVAKEKTSKTKKEEKKKKEEAPKKEKKAEAKEEANYSKADLRLLASLIYAEAGNQPYKGKLAVANVVINRAKSKTFWHVETINEVIYDSKWGIQFSVIKKNSSGISPLNKALKLYDSKNNLSEAEKKNMEQCIKAAKAAFNGDNNIGNRLYFSRNSRYLSNKYSNHIVIGDHIFYIT